MLLMAQSGRGEQLQVDVNIMKIFSMRIQSGYAVVATAIMSLFLLFGCGSEHQGNEIALEKSVRAVVVTVNEHTLPELRFFPGYVKSKAAMRLSAKMPGYVVDMPHEIGDFVRRGMLLARLDDKDIRARIASLRQSLSSVGKERQAVGAQLEYANATFARVRKLFDEKSATRDQYDRASAERDALASRMAALAAREREVKAAISEAVNQLRYVEIMAPSDGYVTSRFVDSGTLVMPGMPIIEFESSEQGAWFAADIDDSLVDHVKSGIPVSIYFPSINRTITAPVSQVSNSSSPGSHTFSILCDLKSSGINSGVYGRVYISSGACRRVLVPCSALVDRGGLKGVYVADKENRLHWRVVKVGRIWKQERGNFFPVTLESAHQKNDEFSAEVLTGLVQGERVVVSNLDQVREGLRLE